jgi:DNA-binding MarR family transcriptional regulator
MRKSEWIDAIETIEDISCSRGDFVAAARIFNNPEGNVSTAIEREEELWGTNAKVARILRIARWRGTTHGIASWTASSSDQILRSLENSTNMRIRWIAGYVKSILEGPINSAKDAQLLIILKKIEKPKVGHRLSLGNIRILAKVSLEEYCVNELINYFKIDNVSMSGHLKRLEKRGYIERYKKPWEDQRKYYVRITAKWRKLIKKIEQELSGIESPQFE